MATVTYKVIQQIQWTDGAIRNPGDYVTADATWDPAMYGDCLLLLEASNTLAKHHTENVEVYQSAEVVAEVGVSTPAPPPEPRFKPKRT